MSSVIHRRFRVWQVPVLLASLVLALVCAPSVAYARSYTVDAVEINSSVDMTGSLWVVERRTYTFNGAYNGIKWTVPRGTFEGREIEPQVFAISVDAKGEHTQLYITDKLVSSFEYEHEDSGDVITINWPAENETVTFQVEYELTDLVSRWSDVAELYWQYVPAAPGGAVWNNVTFTVSLPVPEGDTITAGENVRAWGHGPLNGEVNVAENGVAYVCPLVEDSDYLEARVVFPESWIPEAKQSDEAKLDTILEEEAAWAKEANVKRMSDRAWAYGVPIVMIVAGVGSVIFEQVRFRFRHRKSATSTFAEEYLRDVPGDDHPVVWGQLMDGGNLGNDAFAATLMRLADQGSIGIDATRDANGKIDWRISYTGRTVSSQGNAKVAAVDKAALDLLFETVPEALGETDATSVFISQFNKAAKENPRAYNDAFYAWADAARELYKGSGLEKEESRGDDMVVGGLGLLLVPLAVVLAFTGIFVGSPNWMLVIGIFVCFGGALWCIWNYDVPSSEIYLTQRGADMKARLEALRRWLTDFTNLEEAIPTDVVLWNRLLVAATVLGVAKEVVRKLRVYVPALFRDKNFVGSSVVIASGDDDSSAELIFTAFAGVIAAGVATASSKLGKSYSSSSSSYGSSYDTRDSSSSGSGGGFSGGGGGGFSGGGRGDAF